MTGTLKQSLPLILATIGILMLMSSQDVSAQNTKSIQLKPIFKSGRKYFYDSKKMVTPYSLEIPLLALNNEEINRNYRQFKTLQSLRGLAYLPGLVWLFAANPNSTNYDEGLFYLLMGGLVVDIGINAISHQKMKQAIDLYNIAIMDRSAIGFNMQNIQYQQFSFNIGYKYRFK